LIYSKINIEQVVFLIRYSILKTLLLQKYNKKILDSSLFSFENLYWFSNVNHGAYG